MHRLGYTAVGAAVSLGAIATFRTPALPQLADMIASRKNAVVFIEAEPRHGVVKEHELGSGFFIDRNGNIVTASHVTGDTTKIYVQLWNGDTAPAKVVGEDIFNDTTVIKVDKKLAQKVTPLQFCNSDLVRQGDPVVVVGHPGGDPNIIVTTGNVSHVHGDANGSWQGRDVIRWSAFTDKGDSGGAALSASGCVVAMTDSIIPVLDPFTGQSVSTGVGYGVAANTLAFVAGEIIKNGAVGDRRLHLTVADALPKGRSEDDGQPRKTVGALVKSVDPGSAAVLAGIKPGDIIVEFNETPIGSAGDFVRDTYLVPSGSDYRLIFMRDNVRQTADLVMGDYARPPTPKSPTSRTSPVTEIAPGL